MDRLARFLAKIAPRTDGCWEWTASRFANSYAQFRMQGDPDGYAHRWSYRYFVADIPVGHNIDHLCGHKWCVNPTHLEAVPHVENVRRGGMAHHEKRGARLEWADRTHCRNGHAAGEWYVVRRLHGRVSRICKQCHIATQARFRQRGKAA